MERTMKIWNVDHYDVVETCMDADGNPVQAVVKCLRGDNMNGWTPSISRDQMLTNLIETCKYFLQDDPANEYWKNTLLQAEIEQEARRVQNWLGDVELPETPPVAELEKLYLEHRDWLDEQATRESVRP
jgi:hypothetical protein